jgi:hypothetical protein
MTSPTRQVSLSLSINRGVLETIYNYKRGTEKTILKGCPPLPPKTKAFKKIVSCNGGLIKPTSPLPHKSSSSSSSSSKAKAWHEPTYYYYYYYY